MYDYLSLLFWEKKIHYKTPRGIIKVNTQSTAHMDVDKEKEDKTARYNQAVKRHPDSSYKKTKKKKENHDTHIRNDLRNNSSISKSVACLFWIYSYSFPMDIDFFYFFYWVFFTTFHIPECWLLKTSQVFPSVWFYWTGGRFCCYLRRCDGIKAEPVCQGTINLIGFIGKSASDGDWSHWTL